MENMIKVENLRKSYSKVEAVKGINFTVEKGKFYAFLGENGAGKSTTINIISTLLQKTSGMVTINSNRIDVDDEKIRNDIGVIFQNKMLDDFLTAKENIILKGQMYGLTKKVIEQRMNVFANKIGISEFINRPYGKLSGGQRRKVDIVRALINEPKLLIMDEPTTGLDPYTRQQVWESILTLKEETGLTIFLTTHYMEEASQADFVIIIDKGEIKEQATPEQLRLKYSFDKLIIIPCDFDKVFKALNNKGVKSQCIRDTIEVNIKSSLEAIDIVNFVKEDIEGFEVIRGNMDEVFLNVIGKEKEKGNE